jgi:hypothetical protein
MPGTPARSAFSKMAASHSTAMAARLHGPSRSRGLKRVSQILMRAPRAPRGLSPKRAARFHPRCR